MATDVVAPPLETTSIASGLRSLARGYVTSASWPTYDRHGPATVNLVEIRLILARIDPPTGRLQVTSCAGTARNEEAEIPFTGWLGLLRALYLVTGSGPENR
jgi:hypothetical protein